MGSFDEIKSIRQVSVVISLVQTTTLANLAEHGEQSPAYETMAF